MSIDSIYTLIILAVLFLSLAYCAYTDIKRREIENYITIPLFLLGFIYHGVIDGPSILMYQLLHVAFLFVIFIVPTIKGTMGGGDFKLILALGAMLGASDTLAIFLYACFACYLYFIYSAIHSFLKNKKEKKEKRISLWEFLKNTYIPMGAFIFIGFLIYLFLLYVL